MNDTERITLALQHLQAGIARALAALNGVPERTLAERWAAVYAEIPPEGLPLEKMSALIRLHGFDPRAIGVQVRFGKLVRNDAPYGDSSAWYRRGETA